MAPSSGAKYKKDLSWRCSNVAGFDTNARSNAPTHQLRDQSNLALRNPIQPDRSTRAIVNSKGKVANMCKELVAAADSQGVRREWFDPEIPDAKPPRKSRKDLINSDANRVALCRQNVDRQIDGLSDARSKMKRPASSGNIGSSRPGPQGSASNDRNGGQRSGERQQRPSSAVGLRRSRSFAEQYRAAEAEEAYMRAPLADPSAGNGGVPYSMAAEWKGGPCVVNGTRSEGPLLADDYLNENRMLTRALKNDTVSNSDANSTQVSSAVAKPAPRPVTAPVIGWRQPKPVSRENHIAAALRRGCMRMKVVEDHNAWIYAESSYRRQFPQMTDNLASMDVNPNKYAPTMPC